MAHRSVRNLAWLRSHLASITLCGSLATTFFVAGCPADDKTQNSGPKADTACPKELGTKCKVLKDEWDPAKLVVEYHVLVPAETKHDEAQKYLEALYRHLMTRRD